MRQSMVTSCGALAGARHELALRVRASRRAEVCEKGGSAEARAAEEPGAIDLSKGGGRPGPRYAARSPLHSIKLPEMLHCRRRGKCAKALNRCRDSRCAGCSIEGCETT